MSEQEHTMTRDALNQLERTVNAINRPEQQLLVEVGMLGWLIERARQHEAALKRAETPLPMFPDSPFESGRRTERAAMQIRLTADAATLRNIEMANQ